MKFDIFIYKSALDIAYGKGNNEIVQLLLSRNSNDTNGTDDISCIILKMEFLFNIHHQNHLKSGEKKESMV
ncbi:hypothetical protein TRFO_33549 [Tritrichomonas foetus]|uniref:Ankyrin repeat protein n=1 Tax=Tritrichomonas foetus TaxID=1144522 RepID=A0A1J4JR01_9EUKA|nr:hypothetical protein TRFO_33549 [Tritrichomonas foetus]|eukprot:OHS99939.1 hypothetical protein TRFO_33549 [Tritrichomonas foetus]